MALKSQITWTISFYLTVTLFTVFIPESFETETDFILETGKHNRVKRQTFCRIYEHLCASGTQCIPKTNVCDGSVECSDGSDETFTLCSHPNFSCPKYAFRCSYGACVDGDAACDGVNHCVDRSDELLPECKGVIVTGNNTDCTALQFSCIDGNQCISRSDVCDGKADCQDKSDETITLCRNNPCYDFAFRCAYGACIDGDQACDNITHCVDGSDEVAPQCYSTPSVDSLSSTLAPVIITTPTPATAVSSPRPQRGCSLPPQPENGLYFSPFCQPDDNVPACNNIIDTRVSNFWRLHFQCNDGYRLKGKDSVTCLSGKWNSKFPVCEVAGDCEPLLSNQLIIICLNKGRVPCDKPVANGTRARLRCNPVTHERVSDPGYDTIYCINGVWDKPLFERYCRPVCGKIASKEGQPYVSNGEQIEHGEFPWHAGIYELERTGKYGQICGGSLISTRVVISAAHCFFIASRSQTRVQKSLDILKVALGKYRRLFDAPEDSQAQIRDIEDLAVPEEYTGLDTSYQSDIAVIVMKTEVVFSYFVRPVCLDIGLYSFEEEQLQSGNIGKVVGWGMKENDEFSETLLLAQLPFVTLSNCRRKVTPQFAQYITSDKFCAGNFTAMVNVCPGDSGGGLAFEHNNTHQFYLRGIVSLGARNCSAQQYALFTKISKFKSFIETYKRRYP